MNEENFKQLARTSSEFDIFRKLDFQNVTDGSVKI